VSGLGHVLRAFVLPVHGVTGTLCTAGGVVTLSGGLSVSDIDRLGIRLGVLYVTYEGGHVHLVGTSGGLVDPEPRAHASSVGAGREVGDIEPLLLSGDTVVYNREDDKVAGFDLGGIGLVRDGKGTTGDVLTVGCVDVRPAVTGPGDGCVLLVETSGTHASEGLVGGDLYESLSIRG